MCFLVDDDESERSGSGSAKLQLRRHHTWLIPRRVLMIILVLALIFLVVGLIFLAIGGGVGITALHVIGGILFGFGIVFLIVCLLVCLYAYFVYGTKDQAVQTDVLWTDLDATDVPGYASIGRPSALKSADSTLKRNGIAGQKKVTMAPEVGPYGESPPAASLGVQVDPRSRSQLVRSPSFGSGTVYFEGSDPRGVGGRNVGGADVGSGGIRITPMDRTQPFPSPGSQVSYGSGQAYSGGGQVGYVVGQGHVIYSGGGSSASSSVDATYAYPKSISAITGQESGFSDSGSQYSTLRSIPVTHIVAEDQRRHQDTLEYARINKQAKNVQTITADIPQQRGYIVQGQGFTQSQGQGFTQSQGQGFTQSQGQFEQRFPINDDFDYDNPVERTPMMSSKQQYPYSQSYHEQQMQYQRQQQRQQDLHTPRELHVHSLQRQSASNPYHHQQQGKEQQHQSYQSSTSTSQHASQDDLPDLQPLVYPSARRPMTFEQVSSSKMSVYDNMLAGLKEDE